MNGLIAIQSANVLIVHAEEPQPIARFTSFRPDTDQIPFPALSFRQPDDLFFQQGLRTTKRPLRHVELGLGLEIRGLRHAQLSAVEHRQQLPALHLLTEIRIDVGHSSAHERRNIRHRVRIGHDGPGKITRRMEFAPNDGLHLDPATLNLFRR